MTSFKDAIKKLKRKVSFFVCMWCQGHLRLYFLAGYNQWRKCIEIKVHSEAKENKANNEVIETVAKFFRVLEKDINSNEWTKKQGENHLY